MLRAIFGLDHIVKNQPESVWLATCGYNIYRKYAIANKALIITSDGALSAQAGTSSGNATQAYIDMSPYMASSGYNSFTFGFRLKILTAGNSGALAYIATDSAGAAFLQLLTYAQLPNNNVGSEFYIEFVFDTANLIWQLYIDGVQIGTNTAISGVTASLLRSGSVFFAFNLTGSGQAGLIQLRDAYLVDDIPGDGYIGRLGARVIYPVTLDSATGTDWTSSDGSAFLTALNVPIETAGAATLTSGASKSPLVVGLKPATLPAGSNVEGVFIMAAGKTDISNSLVGVSVTNGGKTIKGQSKAIGSTLKYGAPFGVFARAPDGSRWTAASIDASTLSLTPDVAS